MKNVITAIALTAAFSAPTWAAVQSVTLFVPGMTCASCPVMVKQSLNKVKGVTKTQVTFATKQADVTYDDAQTNVQALIKATTDAGYPSGVKK